MTSPNIRGVTPLLEVFDLGRSVAFSRALGFEVVARWPDTEPEGEWEWVRLRLGDAEVMLNALYERDERPAPRPRPHARPVMPMPNSSLPALIWPPCARESGAAASMFPSRRRRFTARGVSASSIRMGF
jgi:hypothetical protein